ncbi:SusD/RagB family nutrient-binding outer membrane lipoprotein [Portibacter marinus]|uniref:SusD/RagB family nutrient-binding outer membrane lipoprotein n=1 Tax=Portibacter marinus TaxID=2898660 RepID=UPI001F40CDD8|nr:SusD/RagB family nutrient-binding outer membrane lipoprotein [Portibacter marinus]
MKNYIYIILAIGLVFSSCTKDFDEINENPNSSENIDPQFLLANVISVLGNENTYTQGFRLSNYLAQFAASVEFERIDRYEMGTNGQHWDLLYGLLTDINSMQSVEGTNEAYQAVGDIMKSYIFSQLTDLWGDVPYSEALMARDGVTQPKYDTQEAIYTDPSTGILAVLKNAVQTLENTSASIKGDVMFNGNLNKWIRFANALQVRYYLRISDRISDFSALQGLWKAGQLMESNADNAVLPYLANAPNQNPVSQFSLGLYQEHRMTKTAENILKSWDDPRIGVIYRPTEKSANAGQAEYLGIQNGQSRETISANNIDLGEVSLFGAVYRDVPNGVDMLFMLYAEQQFALAEAALKGYIDAEAEALYQSGVTAHFNYLGLEVPDDYFDQETVALDGDGDLEKIMTQKWISLVSNGHEAWFNVRRTGYPDLKPGPDNLNEGMYPVRYLYPESEQATNAEHYEEAVQRLGGDNINNPVWWD